jgi:secreted trypsin-like serine protease
LTIANMKVLAIILALAVAASARVKRPEEHWRPARGRDMSKYQPRHAMYPMKKEPVLWEVAAAQRQAKRRFAEAMSFVPRDDVDMAEECGVENKAGRIVGGHEAAEHEWPWQTAVFIDNMYFCGGALISNEYVLTAAHCADDAFYFDMMLGAHNVRAASEVGRIEITSYDYVVNPGWDANTLSNDLAIVKLPTPVAFNSMIRPSCLPTMSTDGPAVDDVVTCTGWGKPSDNAGSISDVLRMVENCPVISNKECNDIYGIVGSGVICIDTTGGRGTCNGDSGGPLNYKTGDHKWMQVGIVSFGSSAGCERGYPAGFTRVTEYIDWISSQTGIKVTL